ARSAARVRRVQGRRCGGADQASAHHERRAGAQRGRRARAAVGENRAQPALAERRRFSQAMKIQRLLIALLAAAALPASAQPYPSKPVKLVVSSAAGGSPDLQARIFTQRMSQLYGYIWVIENVPGAGANIAPERVAKAPAAAYTLLMASAGPLYFNPTLYTKLAYDIQRDFEPITQVSNVPNILAVHPSVPLRSVKELIDYARANPGKLRFGSPGSGSSQHLSGELFKKMSGVELQHVPYKSVAQMTTELVSGQFELSFNNAPLVLPQHQERQTARARRHDADPPRACGRRPD